MAHKGLRFSLSVTFITKSAAIAAAYTVLTLLLAPFSFGPVQFRISEALCVLPYLLPEAVPGLFVGCVISNLFTPNFLILDVVFGSLATLIAALLTYCCKYIRHGFFLAPLPPILLNAVIIGAVISYTEIGASSGFFPIFAWNSLTVGLSEAVVTVFIGLPLLFIFKKRFYNTNRL